MMHVNTKAVDIQLNAKADADVQQVDSSSKAATTTWQATHPLKSEATDKS